MLLGGTSGHLEMVEGQQNVNMVHCQRTGSQRLSPKALQPMLLWGRLSLTNASSTLWTIIPDSGELVVLVHLYVYVLYCPQQTFLWVLLILVFLWILVYQPTLLPSPFLSPLSIPPGHVWQVLVLSKFGARNWNCIKAHICPEVQRLKFHRIFQILSVLHSFMCFICSLFYLVLSLAFFWWFMLLYIIFLFRHTGLLENFQSHILAYASKRFAYRWGWLSNFGDTLKWKCCNKNT